MNYFKFIDKIGPDFSGETIDILKERIEMKYCEYRTHRLVLERRGHEKTN